MKLREQREILKKLDSDDATSDAIIIDNITESDMNLLDKKIQKKKMK